MGTKVQRFWYNAKDILGASTLVGGGVMGVAILVVAFLGSLLLPVIVIWAIIRLVLSVT